LPKSYSILLLLLLISLFLDIFDGKAHREESPRKILYKIKREGLGMVFER